MKESIETTLANTKFCCEKEDPESMIVAILSKSGISIFYNGDMNIVQRMALAGSVFGAAIVDQQKERLETAIGPPSEQRVH